MHCCSSLQHITSRTARRPHHAARRQPVRGVALSPALAHRPQQWGSLQSLAASRSTSNNSSTSTAASSSTDDSSTLTAAEAAAQRYGWSFPSQDHHHNQQQDPRIQEIPVAAIRRPLGRTRANDQAKVEALMESIREIGLQEPIDVLLVEGKFYGFSGCHRYEAHQRLGLPTIRCRVRKANQQVLRMHMM